MQRRGPDGPSEKFPPEEQPWGSRAPGPSVHGREATACSWKPELPEADRTPGGVPGSSPENMGPWDPMPAASSADSQPHSGMTRWDNAPDPCKGKTPNLAVFLCGI